MTDAEAFICIVMLAGLEPDVDIRVWFDNWQRPYMATGDGWMVRFGGGGHIEGLLIHGRPARQRPQLSLVP